MYCTCLHYTHRQRLFVLSAELIVLFCYRRGEDQRLLLNDVCLTTYCPCCCCTGHNDCRHCGKLETDAILSLQMLQ